MSQPPDTYTLELLGFDRQSPEQACASLASALGLPPDDARFYAERVPVVLRARVPGATAQEMAKALLDAGARVRLSHDGSGRQRVCEPHSPLRPSTIPPELPPSDPLSGAAAADATHPYPPARSETEEPSGPPVSVEPLTVRRARREPSGELYVPTRTRPPLRATGEICAFCGHPRGSSVDTCPRCGWNWRLVERRCASCGGRVVLTSRRHSPSPAAKILFAVFLVLVLAAAAFWAVWSIPAYGVGSGLAGLGAFVALVLLVVPLVGSAWRCERCGTKPAARWIERDQRRRLRRRRIVLAVGIVALAVAAWALAALL
jgi:hypothetical protein